MISKTENSPTFGWHYRMHTDILKAGVPETLKDNAVKVLKKSVYMPDFDEAFLYSQYHFYYPNSARKSYLDFFGNNNAKKLYELHVENVLNNKNKLDEAGRAIHYLQDIAQPNHIEKGSALRKFLDKHMHHDFEMTSYSWSQELIKRSKPKVFISDNFRSLFDDTVKMSLKNRIPNKHNKSIWEEIAQEGVDIAIGATKRFLELMQ